MYEAAKNYGPRQQIKTDHNVQDFLIFLDAWLASQKAKVLNCETVEDVDDSPVFGEFAALNSINSCHPHFRQTRPFDRFYGAKRGILR